MLDPTYTADELTQAFATWAKSGFAELPPAPLPNTAIKALDDEGRVGGYLVVWGSPAQKDLQGEYFTPATELGLDWYPQRPVLYHHGLDGDLKASIVGVIDTLKADDTGLWAEAQLNLRQRYVRAVRQLIDKGVLGWSSGSLPHLVDVEADGQIKRWPIVEGSMTPTPAEPRQTDIAVIKSAYKELGLDTAILDPVIEDEDKPEETPTEGNTVEASEEQDEAKEQSVAATPDAEAKEPEADPVEQDENQPLSEDETKEENDMDTSQLVLATVNAVLEQLQADLSDEERTALVERILEGVKQEDDMDAARSAEVAQEVAPVVVKAVSDFITERENARKAATTAIKGAVKGLFDQVEPQSKVDADGAQPKPEVQIQVVRGTKYHELNSEDMEYLAFWNKQMRRLDMTSDPLSQEFYREYADKASKAYEAHETGFGDQKETALAIKTINAIKSDELNYSTLSLGGDEWVPTNWSSQVWDKARLDNVLFGLFQSVAMPSNPYELPIESTDPTVFFVPESADEAHLLMSGAGNPMPDSKLATGKVTLTAKKLALRVGFSVEVEEDAIIPFIPQLRKQALRAMEDAIDTLLLNGDTESGATGNINLDDAAPAATKIYMALQGIRHVYLGDTTASGVDASGVAPNLSLFRSVRSKLPNAQIPRTGDLAWITDAPTFVKAQGMNEVLTIDKFGAHATVMTGQLGSLDGIPFLVSEAMGLTEADGKISTTGSNNTLGQVALIYRPNYIIGFRRQVKPIVEFISWADAYQMTVTLRIAFARRDVLSAAGLYNIAV